MLPKSVATRKKTSSSAKLSLPVVGPGSQSKGPRSETRITSDRIVATPPIRTSQGIDFLKVNYHVRWEESTFLDILEWSKKRIQETDDEEVHVLKSKGLNWNLQRTGTTKFNYRLKAGDVVLLLNRRGPEGTIPNIRLEIGSLTSQTCLLQTVNDIRHWLTRQGAEFLKEQVSEVHLAVDFIGTDIQTIGIADQDRWIHRSHSFRPNYTHRRLTGIEIGKGDFMLRIYDKVTELKRSEHKQEVFKELWKVPAFDAFPVTRVEYQLRRPVLKEFNHLEYCNGIDTVKQLFFGLKALWKYATSDWAKFMATIVDRDNKHQSRALYSDFWLIVRSVVWMGLEELRREKRTKHKDIDALRKQARGILMSIAAFFVNSADDIDEIVSQSQELIENDLREFFEDKSKFIKRMERKRNEILLDTVPF